MHTIQTTTRLCRAKATSRSIIEEHSAPCDYPIARAQAGPDGGLVALLKTDVHATRLERPRRNLDEHLTGVVLQEQGGGRNHRNRLLRREKRDVCKHSWLEPSLRVFQ